jgi:predicted phosphodiesterase
MRIVFISDLHSNIYAVEALDKELKNKSYDYIYCLGDIVGYGANPKEVVDWVIENVDFSLRGNHDTLISDAEPIDMHNPYTLKAAYYNMEVLEDRHKDYLKSLPKDFENDLMVLTHDEPCIPGSMEYITKIKEAYDTFSAFSQSLCFYGHTHLPGIFEKENNEVFYKRDNKIFLKKRNKYLINPGSIGQPRDKDPRLSYIIFDSENNVVEFYRAEYDVEKAARDILNAGIPAIFANRLFRGV